MLIPAVMVPTIDSENCNTGLVEVDPRTATIVCPEPPLKTCKGAPGFVVPIPTLSLIVAGYKYPDPAFLVHTPPDPATTPSTASSRAWIDAVNV